MTKENDWMLKLQESDRRLVQMVDQYTESSTYSGNVREALIFYIEQNGGDSGDAE